MSTRSEKGGARAAAGVPPGKLEALGREVGALVDEKNRAYGNSFAQSHEILRVLYPSGIRPEQYPDALAILRIIDKLFRIATDRDALGESPYRDVAGYGLLGASRVEDSPGAIVYTMPTHEIGPKGKIRPIPKRRGLRKQRLLKFSRSRRG